MRSLKNLSSSPPKCLRLTVYPFCSPFPPAEVRQTCGLSVQNSPVHSTFCSPPRQASAFPATEMLFVMEQERLQELQRGPIAQSRVQKPWQPHWHLSSGSQDERTGEGETRGCCKPCLSVRGERTSHQRSQGKSQPLYLQLRWSCGCFCHAGTDLPLGYWPELRFGCVSQLLEG